MRHPPTTSTQPRQVRVERHTHRRPAPGSGMPERIRITVLEDADAEALLAMVGRCSAMTLYCRFHGVAAGVSYFQKVLADAAGQNSYAAWIGDRCVGLGDVHIRDGTAEIGVLVEDGWQRRGVGTALAVALVCRARERRSPFLRADLLAENRFALKALAGVGPLRTSWAQGTCTAMIDLGLGDRSRSEPIS
jgi:GNAT superfamily N-acetyltransferase